MKVLSIPAELTYDFLLKIHYAKRIPSISFAFGLFDNKNIIGCITYGTPSSSPLRIGVAGEKNQNYIIELNRLVITNTIKNSGSYLIGNSIKLLPKPSIIISYADLEMNHNGYIYQATNFLYTGLSAKRTDWKIKGMEHLHGQTIADMTRGKENRVEWLKEKYGNDFYLKERSRKHRYIYIHANKNDKKNLLKELKYKILPYPKNESKRYDTNNNIQTQLNLF